MSRCRPELLRGHDDAGAGAADERERAREALSSRASRASATVRPPTSVPPIFTPAAISFGCAGAGVRVVVGVGRSSSSRSSWRWSSSARSSSARRRRAVVRTRARCRREQDRDDGPGGAAGRESCDRHPAVHGSSVATKILGSFVITPSTPAATTRARSAGSSTVQASTGRPAACARSTDDCRHEPVLEHHGARPPRGGRAAGARSGTEARIDVSPSETIGHR